MPYCPKCGIEVESNSCPLCLHQIKNDIHIIPFSHSVELDKKKVNLTNTEKKKLFNASTIFFAVLISSICLTVDLIFDKTLTWSIYPVIVITTFALVTTAAIYIPGIFKSISILLLNLLMLFLLDIQIPVKNFFLMISLPISSTGAIISFIIFLIYKKSKNPGVNMPGYILIGLSLLNITIDLITQNFIYGTTQMTWSLITTVSLMPIAIFLLYIHYVLSKRIDLRKIFHT